LVVIRNVGHCNVWCICTEVLGAEINATGY
jgi:hypothetical protein